MKIPVDTFPNVSRSRKIALVKQDKQTSCGRLLSYVVFLFHLHFDFNLFHLVWTINWQRNVRKQEKNKVVTF